jgi:formamidopyrimidine-DNA glycosylase
MPELPELEVVKEVLQRRAAGQIIQAVQVAPKGGPIVIRDLTRRGFAETLTGAAIDSIARRGKFLIFNLARDSAPVDEPQTQPSQGYASLQLVLNPKLTGRLQLAAPHAKQLPRTHVVFSLSSGDQLRYVDQRAMGQLYLTADLSQVTGYSELGPEPFDISLEEFRARLKPYRGEIKGVLARGEFVAGICQPGGLIKGM